MPTRSARVRSGAAGMVLLLLALPAWWFDRTTLLAAWLAAWCICSGIAMGGLVAVWMHTLTGGAWGERLRRPALAAVGLMPLLTLLFLPILVGLHDLYPWARAAGQGAARWSGELAASGFKDAWLQPQFFVARALAVLLLWNLLAWAARRPGDDKSASIAAASIILYALSVGVAATDWLMSLTPLWYSSVFGLEVGIGQALAGMAFAVFVVSGREELGDRQVRRDVGNLLFTFVLSWGYLAFVQFLIIWAEDLPHEILWYQQRRALPWPLLGLAVVLLQFVVPFFALLFRAVKDSAAHLASVAVLLLGAQFLWICWLVLPSVTGLDMSDAWWLLPLCTLGFVALCRAALPAAAFSTRDARHG